MIRFLAGVVVGSLGATYLIGMLLPATREEQPRDPLPGPRDPDWWAVPPDITTSGGTTWRPDSDKWTITVTQ